MSKKKSDVEKYIIAVLNNKILTCKAVKLAIQRHITDLKKQDTKNFPYYYDEEKGQDVINFIELLTHSKGKWAGKPLLLEPWQKFILSILYGWRRPNGKRRFRKAYIQTARKNGKTIIGAALELYDLLVEAGAEVYSIATKQEQAAISFREAKNMVEASLDLSKIFKVLEHSVSYKTSSLKAMSSQDRRSDGFNPSFVLVDEYHEHPTDELVGVYQSGMVAREQPMLFIVTTAGTDRNKPCYMEYERCKNILNGILIDEATFAIIYELDDDDDWHNTKCWIKSNPNLGVSIPLESLEIEYVEASQKSSKENIFKTKNLNIWTNTLTAWIKPDIWNKIRKVFNVDELEGRDCVGGLDLSQIRDLTVLTWCFPPENKKEKYKLVHYFYIPEETIVEKLTTDNVSIQKWIQDGFIVATPGATINYDYIYKQIEEDSLKYNIREIAYDRYKANDLTKRIDEELGLTLVEFDQSLRGMTEATKEFERYVYEEFLQCFNPVMSWNISCTEVKVDVNGNYKPLKPDYHKSGKRIDGVVTSIMALNRTLHGTQEVGILDNPFTLWAKAEDNANVEGVKNPFDAWVEV